MIFELGKYYEHSSGERMHIIADAAEGESWWWTSPLIAETDGAKLIGAGRDEASSVNWREISRDEWVYGLTDPGEVAP